MNQAFPMERIVCAYWPSLGLSPILPVSEPRHAAAQQRELCVGQLPFPPVAPHTVSKLVIYQAWAVPDVKSDHTLVRYRAQFQNQSSGTVNLTVRPQLAGTFPPGARWMSRRAPSP
jgi:hypothetical protein